MAGKEYSLSRESLRQCEANIYAKENRQCISTPAVFSWARVDYASRAYDKEPGLRLPASASLPLASCWPRPQQLLPVSATGGGRRCCKAGKR